MKLPDEDPEPILIYPNLISVVNSAEPSRAYSDDPVRFAEIGGLVPPADRQFKVTPEVCLSVNVLHNVSHRMSQVSTVVEFRSIDYKMEHCELTVTTPPASATNVTLGLGDNVVDIWNVKSDYPLNAKVLTWNTRPARVSKVDSITVTHGMSYTHRFSCPSDTLHAFEFSSGGDATYVDWTQDHKKPAPGRSRSGILYPVSSILITSPSGVVMFQHASFTA